MSVQKLMTIHPVLVETFHLNLSMIYNNFNNTSLFQTIHDAKNVINLLVQAPLIY